MIKIIRKKVKKIILKINKKNKNTNNRISYIEGYSNIEKIDTNKNLDIVKYYDLYEQILKWDCENIKKNIIKNSFSKSYTRMIIVKGINFNFYFRISIYCLLYKKAFIK